MSLLRHCSCRSGFSLGIAPGPLHSITVPQLEVTRQKAMEKRCRRDAMSADSDEAAGEIAGRVDSHSGFDGSATSRTCAEVISLNAIRRRFVQSRSDIRCEECGGHGCKCDHVASAEHAGKTDQWLNTPWDMYRGIYRIRDIKQARAKQ